MNPQQLFTEINRRSIPRLYVAFATTALLLIAAAAGLLTTFEVAVWKMKVLVRTLAPGKVQAPGEACRTIRRIRKILHTRVISALENLSDQIVSSSIYKRARAT